MAVIKCMLDTNICIYLINQSSPRIAQRFADYRKGDLAISAITWGELCCGISKQGEHAIEALASLLEVVAFDALAAKTFAELTMKNPNRKANFDRLIAAHALSLSVPLVTNNLADFLIYQDNGLKLENWV